MNDYSEEIDELKELERTLVVIKPDGVRRDLKDEIIRRYMKAGLHIVETKNMQVSQELAKKHYPESMALGLATKARNSGYVIDDLEEYGYKILGWLREYITEGPVIAMIIEGKNAIERVREVNGYTDPIKAAQGTIRKDLGEDSLLQATKEGRAVRNIVHASGDKEEAEYEIKLWFGKEKYEIN